MLNQGLMHLNRYINKNGNQTLNKIEITPPFSACSKRVSSRQHQIGDVLGIHQKTVWNDLHPDDAKASEIIRRALQDAYDDAQAENAARMDSVTTKMIPLQIRGQISREMPHSVDSSDSPTFGSERRIRHWWIVGSLV